MKPRDVFKYAAKPLNIFILLSILIFIILFAEVILVQIYWSFKPRPEIAETNSIQWKIDKTAKDFTTDGKILLESSKGKEITIYDANFTKLWQGEPKDRPAQYQLLNWSEGFSGINKSALVEAQRITPAMTKSFEIAIPEKDKIKEIWRYLPEKQIFQGFLFKGASLGFIGAGGYCSILEMCKKLDKPLQFSMYVQKHSDKPIILWETETQLLAIDLENRKTEILIERGNQKIGNIRYKNWKYSYTPYDANYREMINYVTEDGNSHIILKQPNAEITFIPPADWKNYFNNSINFTATKDSILIFRRTSNILLPKDFNISMKVQHDFYKTNPLDKAIDYRIQLYKLSSDGGLKLINEFTWTKPESKSNQDEFRQYFNQISVISPPIFYATVKAIGPFAYELQQMFSKDGEGMIKGYIGMIEELYPRYIGISIAISIVMMVITLLHGWARKNNRLSFAMWVIFVGLFGLAGLITYLAMNHTTTLKCANCGKNRNLDMPECVRCGAKLPAAKELVISD